MFDDCIITNPYLILHTYFVLSLLYIYMLDDCIITNPSYHAYTLCVITTIYMLPICIISNPYLILDIYFKCYHYYIYICLLHVLSLTLTTLSATCYMSTLTFSFAFVRKVKCRKAALYCSCHCPNTVAGQVTQPADITIKDT